MHSKPEVLGLLCDFADLLAVVRSHRSRSKSRYNVNGPSGGPRRWESKTRVEMFD